MGEALKKSKPSADCPDLRRLCLSRSEFGFGELNVGPVEDSGEGEEEEEERAEYRDDEISGAEPISEEAAIVEFERVFPERHSVRFDDLFRHVKC